ncbi:glyoxylase I 4-like [Lolium rigidum]|uniref:glyoxylase I 4-like n=1 Tax=Lolium rigidum TaxID=89674 RepID=UPI001F5C88BF|nr:glyoxylase I 4-like [Lolium rigidum]
MVNTTAASMASGGMLPLASLNHISVVCRSVEESLDFYMNVLGFVPIRRPGSFNFNGAWLFNYGIGIHLLQSEDPKSLHEKTEINPKDNHISFQCESMVAVERRLKELGISYIQRCVEEGGIYVDQIFFHDPDGFMIEICNCDNLPVVPLADHTFTMATCKRAATAAVQAPPLQATVTAAAAQCVSSVSKTMQLVSGEEASHISCV